MGSVLTGGDVIGALCDAISCILKNLSQIKLSRYSRMADFERWIVAAEPSLPWEKGEFLKAYFKNRKDIVNLALDADCVAVAIKNLIQEEKEWEGTAAELLDKLEEDTSDKVKISKFWPKAPNILSNRARRAAPFLRSLDIDIQFDTRIPGSGKRLISIRERQKKIVTPVTVSQDHQQLIENKNKLFNESCDAPVTDYDSQIKRPSQNNLFKNNNMTEHDICDGDFLSYSIDI